MTALPVDTEQECIFGKSPKNWNTDRIRDRLETIVGGEWGDDPGAHDDGVELPVIRVADIRGLGITTENLTVRRVKESKLAGRLIGPHSLVIEKSGGGELKPVGRAVVGRDVSFAAICSNFMAKTDCGPSVDSMYVIYLLDALYSAGVNGAHIQQTTGIQNLRVFDYLNTHVAFPPLPEQQRIGAYLDASCEAIDAAVAAKRGQLDTLSILRDAVIHAAVTTGLNANAEMRESGIDWLPRMPSHWQKKKLKRHVQMLRGQFTHRPRNDPAFYNGPYPFIQTGSISAADKFITEYTQTLNELGLSVSKLFPSGTIVMTITGAKIAEVAVTTFDACFPDSIVGFVPDHRLGKDYLFYVLTAMKPALLGSMIVTTQPNINYVQIGGNYIPLPPIVEQEAIVEQIESKVSQIRAIKDSLHSQIDTLTEYRKSLIHECVTGQRRITEADIKRVTAHG